jgi:hypothetical protein
VNIELRLLKAASHLRDRLHLVPDARLAALPDLLEEAAEELRDRDEQIQSYEEEVDELQRALDADDD